MKYFSTSHVIPHDRAMVLIPGVVHLHALQLFLQGIWDLEKCQHLQFTYSLLIKRILQFFYIALPEVGIEPMNIRLLDRLSSLLSYKDLDERAGVSQTLYRNMCTNFPILGFLTASNSVKVLNTSYWRIAGLRPAIFSGTLGNFEA